MRTQIHWTATLRSMSLAAIVILVTLFALWLPQRARAATLDVCSTCTHKTIQSAVKTAKNGDTIRVAQGTYKGMMTEPNAGDPFTATVILAKNLTLLGGYSANFSQRDPTVYVTTIDGKNKLWPVIGILGTKSKVDGFTITKGRSPIGGGGIWIGDWNGKDAIATISNNRITKNQTIPGEEYTANGAGVLVTWGASATIQDNTIESNSITATDGAGAGIGVRLGSSATIKENQIRSNTTPFITGGGIDVYTSTAQIISNVIDGNSNGGISIYDSPNALIRGNTVTANTSEINGGGIRVGLSTVTIEKNEIANNKSTESGGGGIFLGEDSQGVIQRNQIHHNEAKWNGGGIWISNTDLVTIEENTIANNRVLLDSGGGIDVRDKIGTVTIRQNVISSNTAQFRTGISFADISESSGAIVIDRNDVRSNESVDTEFAAGGITIDNNLQVALGSVSITNNVIVGNQNRGIEIWNASPAVFNNTVAQNDRIGIQFSRWPPEVPDSFTPVLTNNIVVGHSECGIVGFQVTTVLVDHNDVWNNSYNYCGTVDPPSGSNNISADPLFLNAAKGNYHIPFSSPAKDVGTNVDAPSNDKDGVTRPQNLIVDMGAYEVCYVKPDKPKLSAPANNSTVNNPKVPLVWTETKCAEMYDVIVKQDSQSGTVVLDKKGLTVTNLKTKALARGHTYFWQVIAKNTFGNSTSAYWQFYLPP